MFPSKSLEQNFTFCVKNTVLCKCTDDEQNKTFQYLFSKKTKTIGIMTNITYLFVSLVL